MIDPKYFSFLICHHEKVVNIYVNGLPIGVIEDGKFVLHHYTNLNGTKRPLTIDDIKEPRPFKSLEQLKLILQNIIQFIPD